MLLRFTFANYRSFRDEQELSLVAGPLGDSKEVAIHPPAIKEGVLPLAAIYGANASGKTNVLKALQFMSAAVARSHTQWQADGPIPWEPFADASSQKLPSRFVMDMLIGVVRYQYGFALNSEAVLEEWLFAYPKGKKQTWFHRQRGRPISFSTKMPGENKTIGSLTRRNSLFLSAAAQNNHEALLPVYGWFTHCLMIIIGDRSLLRAHIEEYCADRYERETMANLLTVADLGIANLRFEQMKSPEFTRKIIGPRAPDTLPHVQVLHRLGRQSVSFELDEESEGTLAYLALLGPVIRALRSGTVVCIDELDASLHPLLTLELMRLFNNPATNPKGAQLVFNTHDTNLLSSGALRRDQVWFTEKKHNGETQLYPLSDFNPRRQENLENGYLQGRYGAIPFLNPEALRAPFETGNGKA